MYTLHKVFVSDDGRASSHSRRNGFLNCSSRSLPRDYWPEGAGREEDGEERRKEPACTSAGRRIIRTRLERVTKRPKCPQLWSTLSDVLITTTPTSKT